MGNKDILGLQEFCGFIEELVDLQSALLSELFKSKEINNRSSAFFLHIPRSGCVSLRGLEWRFQKHGVGVEFRALTRRVRIVDVEKYGAEAPRSICASRLMIYLSSRQIKSVLVDDEIVDLADLTSWRRVLEMLSDKDYLVVSDIDEEYYDLNVKGIEAIQGKGVSP